VVSGCAAQTEPETFAGMDEVDAVIGNDAKGEAATYRKLPDFGVSQQREDPRQRHHGGARNRAADDRGGFEGHARAFVQVQNGCDHRCTFCVIPYGRGNSRSVPMGAVVEPDPQLVVATATRKPSSPGSTPPAMAPTCRAARRLARWPRPFSNRSPSSSGCGCPRSIPSRSTTR
jgi:hypothetical protein